MDDDTAAEVFGRYASAQAVFAVHLLGVHRRNGSERCQDCGQPHPCAIRRHAAQLILHFGHWDSSQMYTATLASKQITQHRRRRAPVNSHAT